MEYVHEFDSSKFEFSKGFLEDVEKIIVTATENGISLGDGYSDETGAIVNENEISFNGIYPYDCEPFRLRSISGMTAAYPDGNVPDYEFDEYVKTNGRPYDCVVTAVLLRAYEDHPDMAIESDGTYLQHWTLGRELFDQALGREAPMPTDLAAATVCLMKVRYLTEWMTIHQDGTAAIWGNLNKEMSRSGDIEWGEIRDVLEQSGIDISDVDRQLEERTGLSLDGVLNETARLSGRTKELKGAQGIDELMTAKTDEAELGESDRVDMNHEQGER